MIIQSFCKIVNKQKFVLITAYPMSTALRPPECVRGLKKIDKDLFKLKVKFPVLRIESADVGLINRRVRLEPYLIGHKLKPLKNFMDCDNGSKSIVFNPDHVNNEETKKEILKLLERELGEEKISKLNWDFMEKELTFENWDSKTLIKSILPNDLDYSSYTQTGHIVHCNFSDDVLPYKYAIAEILLHKINKCRTVVQKSDIISNVYRNLNLELLAGEEDYVTELKEEGLRFKLDFSKVYWNSRLSHEHSRLIKNFNRSSLVYDACCGIGPFVLPAFMKRRPKRLVANDLNPDSVKWLKVNMELNKIKSDLIDVHNRDAKDFIEHFIADDVVKEIKEFKENKDKENEDGPAFKMDIPQVHVVMNLPAYAVNFLSHFKGLLNGRNIQKDDFFKWNVYCYLFAKSHVDVPDEWYEEEARRMVKEKLGTTESFVVSCHNVRTVSSRKEMFCVHLELPYEYLTNEPMNAKQDQDEDGVACKRSKIE